MSVAADAQQPHPSADTAAPDRARLDFLAAAQEPVLTERSILVPDFADFSSYGPPPPLRPNVVATKSAPAVVGLQPAAPILASPPRLDTSLSRRQPSSIRTSTTSLVSTANSTSPSQNALTYTVSSSSLPPSPSSNTSVSKHHQPQSLPPTSNAAVLLTEPHPAAVTTAPTSAQTSPTTPQQSQQQQQQQQQRTPVQPVVDLRRQLSAHRPELPRSFSLGGSAFRRHNPAIAIPPAAPGTPGEAASPGIPRSASTRHARHSDAITPAEYSLHIVFTQFVRQAEKKLNMCLAYSAEEEPPIASLLGVGADPVFDKILMSLGYIARQKPRPVIDAVMFWRKSKSEAATAAARDRAQRQPPVRPPPSTSAPASHRLRHKVSKSLSDRSPIGHRHQNKSPSRTPMTPTASSHSYFGLHRHNTIGASHTRTSNSNHLQAPTVSPTKLDSAQEADEKSLISIFILCRVLIEVVKQTSSEVLGDEMGDKLEEIVFRQIKTTDPNQLSSSVIRTANWNLFAELLGEMSHLRFASVSDRFIAELERSAGEPSLSKEQELSTQLVIHGMKHLKLKVYPMDAFEETADFISSISKFFIQAHGQRVKQAYCEVMNQFFLSIAGVVTAEVNHPTWVDAISQCYPRALAMVAKQRYWPTAFQLSCTILCVAPTPLFLDNWVSLVESNLSRLKERNSRVVMITGIARLLWVYLKRSEESRNSIEKRLDVITRALFTMGSKKPWLTADPGVVQACVQLIRFVAMSDREYCMKNIVLPLLSSDMLLKMGEQNLSAENLSPERMLVGIRSFIAIASDTRNNLQPPFYAPTSLQEPLPSTDDDLASSVVPDIPVYFKEYFNYFLRVLGKIMLICDSNFGGQVVLDEKLGHTPRTPKSSSSSSSSFPFTSSSNAANLSTSDSAHANSELLLTVFEAIPHCVPLSVTFSKIVEILCKGTAHPDIRVSNAAANALKSLARNSKHSQTIVAGVARYIFNSEERYTAYAEGGLLDSSSIVEKTLKLYVELLNIWMNVIRQKTAESRAASSGLTTTLTESISRGEEMEATTIWSVIEEVESNGLFFLCNHSRAVRIYAVSILKLIREFEVALDEQVNTHRMQTKRSDASEDMSRIIDVLESKDACGILSPESIGTSILDIMSTAERIRLAQLQIESKEPLRPGILLRLCQSDSGIDSAIWLRVFPRFLAMCLDHFPMPVALCRDRVCLRLQQLHRPITEIAELSQRLGSHSYMHEGFQKSAKMHPEILVEQWKLYLVVACCTLTATDDQDEPELKQKSQQTKRKGPPVLQITYKRITSAKALFKMVIPLLQVENSLVRMAVISGLGCININLYKTLIESLQLMINSFSDGRKHSTGNVNIANGSGMQASSPAGYPWRRGRRQEWVRIEVAHVLQLTSHFLMHKVVYSDPWILERQVAFIKNTKNFLSQPDVALDWEYQKLRRYFCGLMQTLYEGIQQTVEPTRWLPFEARISLFTMIEEWCGYGQYAQIALERNQRMAKAALEQCRESGEQQNVLLSSMEVERSLLELSALNAMASILDGPLTETIESHGEKAAVMAFDITAIFTWTHAIFKSNIDRMYAIGKRAIINILRANKEYKGLLTRTISFCYGGDLVKRASETYFFAVADVLIADPDYPCEQRQPIALGLFKIGDEQSTVRVKAASLLKAVEMRFFGKSRVQDYEISISDKTTAVYKRAQFNLSNQFSQDYGDLNFPIFSEITMYFNIVNATAYRDLLAVMVPWISTIELQLDPNGKDPSPAAYMVMTNLFDLTVRFSNVIQNEVEVLWVTLASGRHLGNVRAILDFLINTGVKRRDPAFVEYSKQIVVYLASTPPGAKLVDALVAYIQPTSMLPTNSDLREYPGIQQQFPFVADLSLALPPSTKQVGFSIGQLATILLVDLLGSPVPAMSENLPLLLQVVFILLDHYNFLVNEQARELLVHLIHELSLAENAEVSTETYNEIAEFIDKTRKRDPQTIWAYDDGSTDESSMRKPANMDYMIRRVLDIFNVKYPNLRQDWSSTALTWATTCPVRHFACRSFQIFRSTLKAINQNMLSDMLVRLSNTIADFNPDIQNFAMQILMTLNEIVINCDSTQLMHHPQIFWATVACLQSIHQQEFSESLSILENILGKIDLSDPDVVDLLMSVFPPKWEGDFDGLQKAVLPGLRSSLSYESTLRVLGKLDSLETNNGLIGDDTRLLHSLLANMPRFAHALGTNSNSQELSDSATMLVRMADERGYSQLSRIFFSFARGRFRTKNDFIQQLANALHSTMFLDNEATTMVFLLGILSNNTNYVRVETMEFLRLLFPMADMRLPEFVAIGADLISPLLRLLQTDYADKALQVLDQAAYIPGTGMDRQVLQASLGGRSLVSRQEDIESTATTFGIPDEKGWAVPMPGLRASATRSNVHAVFYSCEDANPDLRSSLMKDTVVQFSNDDYASYGYTPMTDQQYAYVLQQQLQASGADSTLLAQMQAGGPVAAPAAAVAYTPYAAGPYAAQQSISDMLRQNNSSAHFAAAGYSDGTLFASAYGARLSNSSLPGAGLPVASSLLHGNAAGARMPTATATAAIATAAATAAVGEATNTSGLGMSAVVGSNGGYYALERSDTMASYAIGEDADGSVSHMVAALDNLTSFFAEEPTAYTDALQ
ncbi:cell morphogenesis N-terminal-domain-containing protein [Limtongia smithiae]|uniref:cell morphogenesis N-terminal-domain-containing protein n=1 Tax=Limtongia smithiae TaxID=1125753 RepID=UPI0034CE5324